MGGRVRSASLVSSTNGDLAEQGPTGREEPCRRHGGIIYQPATPEPSEHHVPDSCRTLRLEARDLRSRSCSWVSVLALGVLLGDVLVRLLGVECRRSGGSWRRPTR